MLSSTLKVAALGFTGLLTTNLSLAKEPEWLDQIPNENDAEASANLLEKLSKPAWNRHDSAVRDAAIKACTLRSAELIGHDSAGKLRVVRDPTDKRILQITGEHLRQLPPEKVPCHPAAAALYGSIPAEAKRIDQTVTIDPATVRWHTTGLYAAPGEVVTLEFPEAWVGKGIEVQLSGHRDNISIKKKSLLRLPTSPARSFPVERTSVAIAGAFGGAIYINTGNTPRPEEPFDVSIKGALAAPFFVLGATRPGAWKKSIRFAPAPYAELVTPRIALSFPSAWIRDLEDPSELLQYWDKVVALHDELGGMAHIRSGPERVNVDVQISVGLFHAGYPCQGPQKQCVGVVDIEKLRIKGNWGWFHEMGHESQRRPDKAWGWNNPYTFDGSIEVTVNLFSAHAMDRLKMADRGGWSWTASSEEVAQRAHKAIDSGKGYPALGAGEKLAMYLQLRDAFGWSAIQKTMTSYSNDQDKRPQILPKNNQDKRDAFLVRMSETTGRNLAPFMDELWGIELSPASISQVADLPTWLPKGFEP